MIPIFSCPSDLHHLTKAQLDALEAQLLTELAHSAPGSEAYRMIQHHLTLIRRVRGQRQRLEPPAPKP